MIHEEDKIMNHKKRKLYNYAQLNIEIPMTVKTAVKIAAAMRNITINEWVLRIIINALMEEER